MQNPQSLILIEIGIGILVGIVFFVTLWLFGKAQQKITQAPEDAQGRRNGNVVLPYVVVAFLLLIGGSIGSFVLGNMLGVDMIVDPSAAPRSFARYNWHVLGTAFVTCIALSGARNAWRVLKSVVQKTDSQS